MNDEVKRITIDVIDTPRGPVPSAESIKKIIESWNSVIETMNDNLVRLFNLLNKLNENVVKLTVSLNNVSSKTDLLMKSIAEIKITLSEIQNFISKQASIGNELTTMVHANRNNRSSKDSKKGSGLKDLLFNKAPEREISIINLKNLIDQGLISRIVVKSKLRQTKKSKELIGLLKAHKVIGIRSSVQDILKHIKVLCSNLDFDCYLIDRIDEKKFNLYEDIFKAIKTDLEGEKIILVLLNSDDLLSIADKYVDMPRIRLLNVINEIIEKPEGTSVYVIFHLRSEKNLDPLIAKKLRVFGF